MGFDLHLPLALHLAIHFSLAILSGLIFGLIFKRVNLGLIVGILGGFLIDLDHVLEYFFVLGFQFNLKDFFNGLQFLTSDKIYLVFHAYEYFPILIIIAYIFRRKQALSFILITLAFSGLVHLFSDSVINNYPIRNYFITYRASHNFEAKELMRPYQWQQHVMTKQFMNLKTDSN